jgi:hydroxyacylglutathione hydrolase
MESIRGLVEGFDEDTTVYPGHMGVTTLGAERATNPFLTALAR